MLQKTGERQVGATLGEIRDDHKERYLWARELLEASCIVLDAGCGVGYGSVLLSEKVQQVHAVDVSTDAIAYAQRHWSKDNVSHGVQDLHFLNLPDTSKYHAVVAFEIIEHLIEPRLFLHNIHQHLKEGGKLLLSVPNEKRIPHTVDLNPFHIRHYTVEEIGGLLEDCGYRVTSIHSQDEKEISPHPNGNFLLVQAQPQAGVQMDACPAGLPKSALTAASGMINARATALAKAKKDVQTLKSRLEGNVKAAASETARAANFELLGLLNTINQRVQSLEDSTAAELRQKTQLIETREQAVRGELTAAQLRVLSLENENRLLAAEIKRGDEHRSELAQQHSRLQDKITALQQTLTAARSESTRLAYVQDKLKDKQAALVNAQHKYERYAQMLETAESQRKELQAELAASKRATGEAAKLRERAEANLARQVNALAAMTDKMQSTQRQLHAVSAERSTLVKELAFSQKASANAIQRVKDIEEDRARQGEMLALASSNIEALTRDLAAAQASKKAAIETAGAEKDALLNELDASRNATTEAFQRVKDIEEDRARQGEMLALASSNIEALTKDLTAAEASKQAAIEAAAAEKNALLDELAASRNTTTEALQRVKDAEEDRTRQGNDLALASASIEALTQRLDAAESDRKALEEAAAAEKHALVQELANERRAVAKQLNAYEKQVAEAKEALRRLQAETAAKSKEASTAIDKSQQLAAHVVALAAEGDALRKANERLAIEVDKTYSDGNKTLKRHIAKSEAARSELLAELSTAKRNADELTQQCHHLKDEHQRLSETIEAANANAKKQKRQLSNAKEAAAEALGRVGDLEEERARLAEALNAASASAEALKAQLDAANEQKQRLNEELASIKEASATASQQHKSIVDEQARLAKELGASSAQVQALTQCLAQADAQRNELLEEVAAMKTANAQALDRCKETDAERARLADALRLATDQAQALEKRLEASKVEMRELADKLAASKEEGTLALKRCDDIEQERSRLAAALATEAAKANTLHAQVETLQSQQAQTETSAASNVAANKAPGVGQLWSKLKQLGSDGQATRSSHGAKRHGKGKRF